MTHNNADCEDEVSVLHRCDLSIFRSEHRVNRLYLGDINEIRKKEAKAQKYGSQYSEAMR